MNINNKYLSLEKTGKEAEYIKNPPLPISSVGTDYKTANETNLPAGSALLTDTLDGSGNETSQLHNKKITHIIHAAPKPRDSFSTDEDFINCVVKSVQNSIILADREDIWSQIKIDGDLVICLVGGGIYLGSCDPQKLAEGIIRGAANQLEKCNNLNRITLIDWEGNPQHHFLTKILQLKNELFGNATFFEEDNHFVGDLKNNKPKGISVRVGDIRDNELHKGSVIVNAANTYVGFGGGISGAIGSQTGNSGAINQKAKELIKNFYSLIPEADKNGGDDNSAKISFRVKYCGPGNIVGGSWMFCQLDSNDNVERDNNGYQIFKQISSKHPALKNPPYFWKAMSDVSKQIYATSKITVKAKDKDKDFFEENDFLEIEEIKNDDKDKDNKTASEWQTELKKVDNNIGQIFNEDKVKEWKEQNNFGRVEKVKELLESVKNNSQFLNLIKTKLKKDNLEKLISDKTAVEVIKIIKRFEYDNLTKDKKKVRNKKMRKYYNLGENTTLDDNLITEYCYKVAVGQINESSINENEQGSNNTVNPENNILKILGIGALILIPLGLLLIFFIRKRKIREVE